MVVNTRRVAAEVYRLAKPLLAPGTICCHLSTSMCPAQRTDTLKRLRAALEARKENPNAPRVVCVATALVEAGVDLSLSAVIRSNAGLSSILQAAGRCNRSMEIPLGTVFIWTLAEEKLAGLKEIRQGQDAAAALLDAWGGEIKQLDDPETIRLYYEKERHADPQRLFYQEKGEPYSLCQLLSRNMPLVRDAQKWKDGPAALARMPLRSSCRTAGRRFQTIDDNTVGVLVPYRGGEQLIRTLQTGKLDLKAELRLLKQAQRYTVGLYESDARKLTEYGALSHLGESGILALDKRYLDEEIGVKHEWQELDLLDM